MTEKFQLHLGDSFEVLKTLPENSVDSCVTDPPYGIRFMGKAWHVEDIEKRYQEANTDDAKRARTGRAAAAGKYDLSNQANQAFEQWTSGWAQEVFRVLKPGGHLVSFASTRTYHRMVCGIEDAGFEIRDQLAWVFGSGFPKSLNIGKALDRSAGITREVIGIDEKKKSQQTKKTGTSAFKDFAGNSGEITNPKTAAAKKWDGWGTALKPGWEPIVLARKPFTGPVAKNAELHGTGALNIDACRVVGVGGKKFETPRGGIWKTDSEAQAKLVQNPLGRWPANLCHDGSPEVEAMFPESDGQQGDLSDQPDARESQGIFGDLPAATAFQARCDRGSAARFFYCAKASREDREAGLDGFNQSSVSDGRNIPADNVYQRGGTLRRNTHPTVKPTELMRWLCRLITPQGGVILDPFLGSGSTGRAAIFEGFQFIGIDREAGYLEIARARIKDAIGPLFAAAHEDAAAA